MNHTRYTGHGSRRTIRTGVRWLLAGASLWLLLTPMMQAAAQKPAAKSAPVTRARAVELFATNCSVCHGPDGAGAPLSPDLAFKARATWKHGSRPQDIAPRLTQVGMA